MIGCELTAAAAAAALNGTPAASRPPKPPGKAPCRNGLAGGGTAADPVVLLDLGDAEDTLAGESGLLLGLDAVGGNPSPAGMFNPNGSSSFPGDPCGCPLLTAPGMGEMG